MNITCQGGRARYLLKIDYRIVANATIDPNHLLYRDMQPENVYSVVFRKKAAYQVASLSLEHKKLELVKWEDQKECVKFDFKPRHTFDDIAIVSDITLVTTSGDIIAIPLKAAIKEYIHIEPKHIILGIVRKDQVIKKELTIKGKEDMLLCEFDSDFNNVDFTVTNKSKNSLELTMVFKNELSTIGAFKKSVQFAVLPYDEEIKLSVYGVFVENK